MLLLDYRAGTVPVVGTGDIPKVECGIRPALFAADFWTAFPCISSHGGL